MVFFLLKWAPWTSVANLGQKNAKPGGPEVKSDAYEPTIQC